MERSCARLAGVMTVAVGAVLLAGCASSADEPTPLEQYFSDIGVTVDVSDAQWQEQVREQTADAEDLVAACMAEAGFEYEPMVDSADATDSSDLAWEPDDPDWVAEYGYGIVRTPWSENAVEPAESVADPNREYVDGLSESDQQAYYEALYGTVASDDVAADPGCSSTAAAEVAASSPEAVLASDEFAPLMQEIDAFYATVYTDSRFADLNDAWSSCMTDAGYPGFAYQSAAEASISAEYDAVWQDTDAGSELDSAIVDALADKEVALALADLDCREDTDYAASSRDIRAELEDAFMADHRSELADLKQAVAEAQGD